MNKETVEEFLARGGKINGGTINEFTRTPIELPKDYSDKDFENKLHDFYNSKNWKDIKKKVYTQLTHMCCVCGSTNNLVVDHIKPVRYFWEQRLDEENLQILCNDCNLEKGSKINWTKEWHIKNKDILAQDKVLVEKIYTQKPKIVNSPETFSGLEEWEKITLNSCYASYTSHCKRGKIEPVSKLEFRKYVEYRVSKNLSNPWFYDKQIKKHVKTNFRTIGRPKNIKEQN